MPRLQRADSHTDAGSRQLAVLPQTAYLRTSAGSTTEEGCSKQHQGSNRDFKRDIYNNAILQTFVENIPRGKLLDGLAIHWEAMKTDGIFAMPSREVLTWTIEGDSKQVRRLHHHLVLRHLDIEHDLYQWRR